MLFRSAEQQVNESVFSPGEIKALNQYLDDEISFIELRRGYPGVISKAAQQFGIGPVRGFQGEMKFFDRMRQARAEGDIPKPGVAEGDNLATFVGPNEDSTDAMDHRGAVTDSFYEDLARIKTLALSK